MYLMMYLDEAGKVVYTLKARALAHDAAVFLLACADRRCAPPPAEDRAGRQAHAVGAPGALLAG